MDSKHHQVLQLLQAQLTPLPLALVEQAVLLMALDRRAATPYFLLLRLRAAVVVGLAVLVAVAAMAAAAVAAARKYNLRQARPFTLQRQHLAEELELQGKETTEQMALEPMRIVLTAVAAVVQLPLEVAALEVLAVLSPAHITQAVVVVVVI